MHSMKFHRLFYLGCLLLSAVLSACTGRTAHDIQLNNSASSDRTQQKNGANGNEEQTMLNVVAKGFTLALDGSSVHAGSTTFYVKNDGTMPHNFGIQGNGVHQETPILNPGEAASLTVDLQPGTYTYKCTVHFHYLLGMQGTLTVTNS